MDEAKLQTSLTPRVKERKKFCYEHMMTPYEKLKSLPDETLYLKPGITFEQLDAVASGMSDNDAAALNKAREALFQSIAHALKQSA